MQQDLSEFLLPGQQDLLTVNTNQPHEFENENFNLPLNTNVVTESSETSSQTTTQNPQNQPVLQDLSFQNLENFDTLLTSRTVTEHRENSDEMHSSLPSMIRTATVNGQPMDYHQTWSGTTSKHPEAFAMRKIKVSTFANNGLINRQ